VRVFVEPSYGSPIILLVQGQVVAQIPRECSVGEIPLGGSGSSTILLRQIDGKPSKITGLEFNEKVMKVVPEWSDSLRGWQLAITYDAVQTPGPFSADLRVHTDDVSESIKTVRVTGTVRDVVTIDPTTISFGLTPANRPVSKFLTIKGIMKPVRILAVTSNLPEHLTATLVPNETDSIRVAFDGYFAERGILSADLSISFELGKERVDRKVHATAMRADQ
jgi:hypothetical protein